MNIKIDTNNSKFKFRIAGLLINDNKFLTVQMMDNGIYCLPGGHTNIGEDTIETIEREMLEEPGIIVKVDKLSAIVENFFERSNGDIVHELSFIYTLKLNDKLSEDKINDWVTYEEDEDCKKKLEFKWIKKEDFSKFNIKPIIIKDIINDDDLKHYIIRNGNVETFN